MKILKKYQNYLFYHLPWQLLLLAIFIVSSISQQDLPDFAKSFSDKLLHFIAFGLLGLLMVHSFKQSRIKSIQKYAAAWAVVLTSSYGIIDEVHQKLVPGRFSSAGDWLADTLGALFMIALFLIFRNYRNRQRIGDEAI